MSPEVLNLNYTEKCDIWSVGIVAYEILSKLRPFDNFSGDNENIFNQIKYGSFEFDGALFRSRPGPSSSSV